MPQSIFKVYNTEEFIQYIRNTHFKRKITFIQNHHTWKPDYSIYNSKRYTQMMLLENMRRDHIQSRKWSDIGQNITIFPDGAVAICRALDITPAGIYGANKDGICIEALGNFDKGGDVMTEDQRDAIIITNAILCLKFGLKVNPRQVVYHHWYDRKGKRFDEMEINTGIVQKRDLQKSCPGTNFFTDGSLNGNTIDAARQFFLPLVEQALGDLEKMDVAPVVLVKKRVTASKLNVRSGRGVEFNVVRQLHQGLEVNVYEVADDWSRINANAEEWVTSKFLN